MSDIAISVEHVFKQYRLGLVSTGTLSHDLNRWWHRIRGKEDPYLKISASNDRTVSADSEYVWALQDINFEVKKGEVLGIIGRNGAGKSTLLKILSKVTGPTRGCIKIHGRIASLLEVGTGFHPELTGRENIFLNGAILGMTKTEIKNKFDEIVDFSGVERYIDTPVKRYSSGMYVRLAFAVAAHLEPEILIVDEVLAVGDAEFQKKCLGKMKDVSEHGRTILFVSHNMAAVKTLCTRAVLVDQGTIRCDGNVEQIVHRYLTSNGSLINHKFFSEGEVAKEGCTVLECGIKAKGKSYEDVMRMDEELLFSVRLRNDNFIGRLDVGLQFKGESGDILFVVSTGRMETTEAKTEFICTIPANFFNEGDFYANLMIVQNRTRVVIRENDLISFTVQPIKKTHGGWVGKTAGPLRPQFQWEAGK